MPPGTSRCPSRSGRLPAPGAARRGDWVSLGDSAPRPTSAAGTVRGRRAGAVSRELPGWWTRTWTPPDARPRQSLPHPRRFLVGARRRAWRDLDGRLRTVRGPLLGLGATSVERRRFWYAPRGFRRADTMKGASMPTDARTFTSLRGSRRSAASRSFRPRARFGEAASSILSSCGHGLRVRVLPKTQPCRPGFDPLAVVLFEAIVEGAFLVANSDGVFDADERKIFPRRSSWPPAAARSVRTRSRRSWAI